MCCNSREELDAARLNKLLKEVLALDAGTSFVLLKEILLHWDQQATQRITQLGISWEKARQIVGLLAEERQIADQAGYKRGFEAGYQEAQKKFQHKDQS